MYKVTVSCDVSGCGVSVSATIHDLHSGREKEAAVYGLMATAKAEGWVFQDGHAVCPFCWDVEEVEVDLDQTDSGEPATIMKGAPRVGGVLLDVS